MIVTVSVAAWNIGMLLDVLPHMVSTQLVETSVRVEADTLYFGYEIRFCESVYPCLHYVSKFLLLSVWYLFGRMKQPDFLC